MASESKYELRIAVPSSDCEVVRRLRAVASEFAAPLLVAEAPCYSPAWIAGRVFSGDEQGRQWEILGLYVFKDHAIKRCKTPDDFVAPIIPEQDQPEEPTEWEGCEWPLNVVTP